MDRTHLSLSVSLCEYHSYFNVSSSVIHCFLLFVSGSKTHWSVSSLLLSLPPSLPLINLVGNIYQHFDEGPLLRVGHKCVCGVVQYINFYPQYGNFFSFIYGKKLYTECLHMTALSLTMKRKTEKSSLDITEMQNREETYTHTQKILMMFEC